MKKFLGLSLIFIFLFLCSLFSSQPPEYGLIFGSNDKKNVVARYLKSRSNKGGALPVTIAYEMRKDGSQSQVCKVRSLPEFLYLYAKNLKPLVIKVFYGNDQSRDEFHELAEQLKEKAFFISIDAQDNPPIVQLFTLILLSNGTFLPQGAKFPLFLLCKRGFVQLQKRGVLNFTKENLGVLISPGAHFLKKNDIIAAINKNAGKKANYGQKVGEKENSLWQKIKSWFSSKLSD